MNREPRFDNGVLKNESATGARSVRRALGKYQEAVVNLHALDPVITEMVRLRCARSHDCRVCQTLRFDDAAVAGVDEKLTAKIDFYERSDLDERIKVALRLTDAFISGPADLTAELAAQAHAHFSDTELAELCLDITKWSTQKINVALGIDGADALPKNAEGVSFVRLDADGRIVGYFTEPSNTVGVPA
jgi:alkylhydroperoxidase family enzyme